MRQAQLIATLGLVETGQSLSRSRRNVCFDRHTCRSRYSHELYLPLGAKPFDPGHKRSDPLHKLTTRTPTSFRFLDPFVLHPAHRLNTLPTHHHFLLIFSPSQLHTARGHLRHRRPYTESLYTFVHRLDTMCFGRISTLDRGMGHGQTKLPSGCHRHLVSSRFHCRSGPTLSRVFSCAEVNTLSRLISFSRCLRPVARRYKHGRLTH